MSFSTTLATDANNRPIQNPTGFQLTTPPYSSPIASDTSSIEFGFPANSISCSIYCKDADAHLSKTSDDASYCIIPKGSYFTVPGFNGGDLFYINRPVATEVHFAFEIIA